MLFRKRVPKFVDPREAEEFLRAKERLRTERLEKAFKSKQKEVKQRKAELKLQKDIAKLKKPTFSLRKQAQQFGRALPQEIELTQEQFAMQQLFGEGGRMWGTNMNPVEINHSLNPGQRGDNSTARMFGFG